MVKLGRDHARHVPAGQHPPGGDARLRRDRQGRRSTSSCHRTLRTGPLTLTLSGPPPATSSRSRSRSTGPRPSRSSARTTSMVVCRRDGAGPTAGAAVLAGAVKQLRAANPDTVFAAAGDLIGASTFESFIQHDKPTIDALNEAGLEVSAAGNHEFDQGYDDLVDRVMAPYWSGQPGGWRELAVHRGQPAAAREPDPARAGADVHQDDGWGQGRLRGCGDRAPRRSWSARTGSQSWT